MKAVRCILAYEGLKAHDGGAIHNLVRIANIHVTIELRNEVIISIGLQILFLSIGYKSSKSTISGFGYKTMSRGYGKECV